MYLCWKQSSLFLWGCKPQHKVEDGQMIRGGASIFLLTPLFLPFDHQIVQKCTGMKVKPISKDDYIVLPFLNPYFLSFMKISDVPNLLSTWMSLKIQWYWSILSIQVTENCERNCLECLFELIGVTNHFSNGGKAIMHLQSGQTVPQPVSPKSPTVLQLSVCVISPDFTYKWCHL